VALAALGSRIRLPAPPDPTLRGVADVLGESVQGKVLAHEFLWESSRGAFSDAIFGRNVLFLAKTQPDGPRDLYRAAVRVTYEGRPIGVSRVVNLTDTPFGDEQGLMAAGQYVAYATVAFGAVQQVTVLDLQGQEVQAESRLSRWLALVSDWQSTGSWHGLGRTEVSANLQASSATMSFGRDVLNVSTDSIPNAFSVSLATGEVVAKANESLPVSSMRLPQLAKSPILWAVDTVRGVTGPEFIAWLEDHVFDARDRVKRAGHHAFGATEEGEEQAGPVAPPPPQPKKVEGNGQYAVAPWPPENLRSIWKTPEPDEGLWREPNAAFLQKNEVQGGEQPPAYFFQTYVRPDPKRPWSKVWLVAMDARQIQVGIEGGIEDPKPLTGARGEGRIPREPEILHRTVGAFNGGFKTTHGEYGMMVSRRVLLPAQPGAATVAVTEDGRAAFGTWPLSTNIPEQFTSFRQNLDPLVDDGKLNPSNRKQWGWHLHTTGMLTHRSGFCLTSAGQMVYAWGPEVTGETLGYAMIQAGCTYAIHLDMNPRHTAFAYIDARQRQQAKLLHPGMEVLPERFIVWSPKDFFYLTLRNFNLFAWEGVNMLPDKGRQPPPVWVPAVFEGRSGKGSKTVQITAFRLNRLQARWVAEGEALETSEVEQALAAIVPSASSKGPGAMLILSESGEISLVEEGKTMAGRAVRLPLLDEKEQGAEHVAMCITRQTLWVGRTMGTAAHLAQTLRKSGCELVVSLGQGAAVHRTGTSEPTLDRYPTAALYLLGRSLSPGAFRWQPGQAAAQ